MVLIYTPIPLSSPLTHLSHTQASLILVCLFALLMLRCCVMQPKPSKRDTPEKPAKDAEGEESSEEEFEWENDSVAKLADWVMELKQATATLLKRNGELRTK
eukprot:1484534-Rhodomonas_salina.1